MRAYGVHFSLDDFGTGHSNLNYIVDMPVNIVKFDKEMINSYFENGKAKYALFPIWILNTAWKGEKYTFAMNGQTGKMVGDLPVDKGAFTRWLFGLWGIASAVIFGICYLLWLI